MTKQYNFAIGLKKAAKEGVAGVAAFAVVYAVNKFFPNFIPEGMESEVNATLVCIFVAVLKLARNWLKIASKVEDPKVSLVLTKLFQLFCLVLCVSLVACATNIQGAKETGIVRTTDTFDETGRLVSRVTETDSNYKYNQVGAVSWGKQDKATGQHLYESSGKDKWHMEFSNEQNGASADVSADFIRGIIMGLRGGGQQTVVVQDQQAEE